ncbi:MAG: tRNA (guanosine(37)-N1)-methyltransferase TrmD [Candidatus Zambryskibacteria bacterium]|nr:tRNA (guanosine(37)-N1)-methyltransferase TrmD [Candidatus Zambryskibacteria bacterium]
MQFHIITLFPDAFNSYFSESVISRAIKDKRIKIKFYNPRDFTRDKWQRIDRKPYSGGPGMVLQALPVAKAIQAALAKLKAPTLQPRRADGEPTRSSASGSRPKASASKVKIIWLAPSGKQFDTAYAKKSAKKFTDIILVSGRYEGIDTRVKKIFKMENISVGPYVLTGGELPAMILIDCMARQIPGVLGNFDSLEESRVSSHDVYTRPEVFEYKGKKYRVPKVLLSGHHKKIENWKKKHI